MALDHSFPERSHGVCETRQLAAGADWPRAGVVSQGKMSHKLGRAHDR